MNEEVRYLLIVVGLFLVPRILQRLRIPSAITCVGLGALLGMGFGQFHDDQVLPLLSTLGIVALFLLAGLEVDLKELRRGAYVTVAYVGLQLVLLALGTWLSIELFQLGWRAGFLLASAVLTPSTGFILDSLGAFGLSSAQQYWVKTKAIASELVALLALFLVVQSSSAQDLALASVALVGMVALLPLVFQVFAKRVLPFAPKSEFAFMLMLALLCAFVTRRLGVYYLVGAFVVGVTAVQMRKRIPELTSERLVIGIELFASFFIPFYFFKAGVHLGPEAFTSRSVMLGLAFVALTVPLRVLMVMQLRVRTLGESRRDGAKVGWSLVPTLVFTLVLANILKERYALPEYLFGALTVFALVNTAIPGFVLGTAPPDFVAPVVVPGSTLKPAAPASAPPEASQPDAP